MCANVGSQTPLSANRDLPIRCPESLDSMDSTKKNALLALGLGEIDVAMAVAIGALARISVDAALAVTLADFQPVPVVCHN